MGPSFLQAESSPDVLCIGCASIVEVRRWVLCWEHVRYSGLKEAAFVRRGRYGISIDFGLEIVGRRVVVGRTSILSSSLFPMTPRLHSHTPLLDAISV